MTTKLEAKFKPHGRREEITLDLTEFLIGGNKDTVQKLTSWGGDYKGRPQLACEIAGMFENARPHEDTCKQIKSALRVFFRYLDWREHDSISKRDPLVASCSDITDAMGRQLRQWLGRNRSAYKTIKTYLNKTRDLSGCRRLFWPSRQEDRDDCRTPPSKEAIRRLVHELRREAHAIKAMFKEGEMLVSEGHDPRTIPGEAAWRSPANRALLTKFLLDKGVPDRARLSEEFARRLLTGPGPVYISPAMHERYSRGLSGALRWFVPSLSETAVFLWLFLFGTGWNPSTACGVDVLDPEGWSQPHPHGERFEVIHAWKNRADRHQFAISMKKPEWHPYRVLQYMIERTAPLRRHVLAELAHLRRRAAADPRLKLEREIEHLDSLSRTPWLFAVQGRIGGVSGFLGKSNTGLLEVARSVAEKSGLTGDDLQLGAIVTKDARLAWIGYVYVQSGYNLVLTKLAGNHANLRTMRHYIRALRYRAYSEEQVRKLQNAMFAEIGEGRVVDPTRLRLLVAHGKITPEQEQRLQDYRQRSALGMGCLDPHSPPKQIDPDHPEGALCRIQRCTGCPNGIVFPESMPPLARRHAELVRLKRIMPLASWDGSSLADEHDSIEQTLKHFDAQSVSVEVAAWTAKLNSGEIAVHGTYPSY